VVGGIHPSSCPEDFAGTGADIIVLGMGKYTFYRIIKEYKKWGADANYAAIDGLALKQGDSLQFTSPTSELSFQDYKTVHFQDSVPPNRQLTERYNYYFPKLNRKVHYLSTSWGCTHRCNFCYLWKMTDGRYMHREVEAIISEIKTMDDYPIIRLCDANTFGNVGKVRQLFNRIIEEKLNNHVFYGDLRTDTVIQHPDLPELGSRAGLKAVICGLEAASNKELELYNKSNTVENIQEALKILNEAGILVNGNYIVRPDYDEKDFERILRFIDANPIFHSGFTILTPFPGTEQWDELKDQIVIRDFDYYNLTNAVLKTKLPESVFYKKLNELYTLSGAATEKFYQVYGNPLKKMGTL
jgi:radical SAM superfamily enzyme YgiQ (UPF0313 family)